MPARWYEPNFELCDVLLSEVGAKYVSPLTRSKQMNLPTREAGVYSKVPTMPCTFLVAHVNSEEHLASATLPNRIDPDPTPTWT